MASIEQRGDSYRVVWRVDGRKTSTTWPTREYAEEARAIVEGHRGRITAERVYADMGVLDLTEQAAPTAPALRAWCTEWLPTKTRITPGTRATYEQQLRDHILPEFGDTPVDQITALQIGAWLNTKRASGVTNTGLTRHYSLLHAALDAAVRHGHVKRNPCDLTDFVRDQRPDDDTGEHKAVYLTPREYQLLRVAFPSRWHELLDTLSGTGARWSEATALAVEHIVAPTKTQGPRVRIWRAWKKSGTGGGRYLGTTKGRQKRTIGITKPLYKALQPLIKDQKKGTLVFRTSAGARLDYSNFYHQVWQPAVLKAQRCAEHPPADQAERRAGARGRCRDFGGVRQDGKPCGARVVPDTTRCKDHQGPPSGAISTCDCPDVLRVSPTPHDLRHSHAAWLFSDPKVTPLAISRRLGHAQLSTTSEIYGDLMPEAEDAVISALTAVRSAGRNRRGRTSADR